MQFKCKFFWIVCYFHTILFWAIINFCSEYCWCYSVCVLVSVYRSLRHQQEIVWVVDSTMTLAGVVYHCHVSFVRDLTLS